MKRGYSLLAVVAFFYIAPFVQAEDPKLLCEGLAPPSPSGQTTIGGEVAAKIKGLGATFLKWLNPQVGVSGNFRTDVESYYKDFPDANKADLNVRLIYLACTELNSQNLTPEQRSERFSAFVKQMKDVPTPQEKPVASAVPPGQKPRKQKEVAFVPAGRPIYRPIFCAEQQFASDCKVTCIDRCGAVKTYRAEQTDRQCDFTVANGDPETGHDAVVELITFCQ